MNLRQLKEYFEKTITKDLNKSHLVSLEHQVLWMESCLSFYFPCSNTSFEYYCFQVFFFLNSLQCLNCFQTYLICYYFWEQNRQSEKFFRMVFAKIKSCTSRLESVCSNELLFLSKIHHFNLEIQYPLKMLKDSKFF